jgi:phosphatidylserine decarboxylase precursor
MSEILYKQKYLKYKKKYIELKGGKGNIYDIDGKPIEDKQPLYIKTGVMTQHIAPKFILKKITEGCNEKKNELPTDEKKYEAHRKLIEEYNIDKTLIDCNEQKEDINKVLKKKDLSYDDLEKLANLDLQKKCLIKYKSKNEFFARNKLDLPEIHSNINNEYITSAADAYCTMFESEETSKQYWIKGDKFTIKKLLYGSSDVNETDNAFLYNTPKYITIMRLAPGHYHRFHCPVTGIIESIYQLGNSFYSVQPSIVNSGINVYTDNKRCVVTIRYNDNKILKMIVVGATCVGSIEFNKKLYPNETSLEFEPEDITKLPEDINKLSENINKLPEKSRFSWFKENIDLPKKYKINPNVKFSQNEELGNFNFGGSTVIYVGNLEDVKKNELSEKLIKRSNEGDETAVVVGTRLLDNNTII